MESILGSLICFDLDNTLFRTSAKILVIKNNIPVKELDHSEFEKYNLKNGEHFDFSEYRSAKVFYNTSVPIAPMIDLAKDAIRKTENNPNNKVIILTARTDLDNPIEFLATFKKHGLNPDRMHVERAGNIYKPAPEAKAIILKKYFNTGKFNATHFFDDSKLNLNAFISLKPLYRSITFTAFWVNPHGKPLLYNVPNR